MIESRTYSPYNDKGWDIADQLYPSIISVGITNQPFSINLSKYTEADMKELQALRKTQSDIAMRRLFCVPIMSLYYDIKHYLLWLFRKESLSSWLDVKITQSMEGDPQEFMIKHLNTLTWRKFDVISNHPVVHGGIIVRDGKYGSKDVIQHAIDNMKSDI